LWLLLLLQVSASCLWLGHSEVFNDFASCLKFFYEKTPPNNALEPQNPAWICQRYRNQYHFATLYDKTLRIPVYSAYIYQPGSSPKPQSWFVEPQLIGKNNLKDMETESTLIKQHAFTLKDIEKNQAVLEDYNNLIGLDRGHLSPSGHQNSFISKSATFTLTNIVPQDSSLNKGTWNTYEFKTMAAESKGCTNTYVITGAVPGNTMVKNRVNVPSHIWSAACCVVGTTPVRAWGVIVKNDMNHKFPLLKLGQLETDLTKLYGGKQVTLFNSSCPRQ
ncbi:ENDD1 protein, partial [Falcunculus frontatus]|nr:ENDD1 protein [Falcunculus frontatus]